MIKINDSYYIDVDTSPICYTVKRRWMSQPKGGGEAKERFAVVGYWGTVEGALKGLVNQVDADTLVDGSYSLEEALSAIQQKHDELYQIIEAAISKLEVMI